MEAWERAWQTEEGRAKWLTPEPFVVDCVEELRRAGVVDVLDLGYGVGRHAILLAEAGFTVAGLDASASGQRYAQEWADRAGVTLALQTGDMGTLPYADGAFDAILTWNVIYHGWMHEIQQTINEMTRCLKPQGYLICSLISTRHHKAGEGEEIEPRTYVIPGGGEREHPHHYFNRDEIDACFGDYTLLRLEDSTQKKETDYHWHMFARRRR